MPTTSRCDRSDGTELADREVRPNGAGVVRGGGFFERDAVSETSNRARERLITVTTSGLPFPPNYATSMTDTIIIIRVSGISKIEHEPSVRVTAAER